MSNSTTSTVYVQVIEDVVTKIREEFTNNAGPGEGVLNQLQGLWELKMMQAGGILGPVDTSSSIKSTTPVRDLNVPYEGPDEYETPTADLLFPPTPLQTPPLPGTVDTSYSIPTAEAAITPNDFSPMNENGVLDNRVGRPSLYMQPPVSWLNKRPPLDVNLAYLDGRGEVERGSASQPTTQDLLQVPSGKRKREDLPSFRPDGYIPQQDGAVDIYNYQGVVSEDYNVASKPDPPIQELQAQTVAMVNRNDVSDDDEDEPLNENDDDDVDLDDVDQGEELNTHHLVLAQFDKVTRTKSRWKCTLKDSIMRINNKDILFNKAAGEFDF